MDLDKKDYITILKYYNVPYKKNNLRSLKKKAHHILIAKLCDCIKAVQNTKTKKKYNRKFPIAVCTKIIFSNRRLKHYRFTCKKRKLYPKKGTRKILTKTGKIHFNKKGKRRRKKKTK